jgi:hypothetical protein
VVKASDAPNWNDLKWNLSRGVGEVSGGDYRSSNDDGANWSVGDISDLWFKAYASAVLKDNHQFVYDGANSPIGGNTISCQSFTASSTYTITSVKLELSRDAGDSPGTVTVSIKATVGAPEKAITPAPANAATDVTLDQATLTWEDGGNTDTYNVYYGDTSGALGSAISSAQAGTSLTVTGITLGSPYDYVATRYWRIDSTNAAGTTTGDEWSFTTINFDQLRVTYKLISGGSGNGPYDTPTPGVEGTDFQYTGENNMITVRRLVAAANNKIWIEGL